MMVLEVLQLVTTGVILVLVAVVLAVIVREAWQCKRDRREELREREREREMAALRDPASQGVERRG